MICKTTIDWSATAAWVQAFGTILAVLAASRVVVLQKRLDREQTVEGIFAVIGVAHQVLEDAAAASRDHNENMAWLKFDSERFDDTLSALAATPPSLIGDMRLVELLAAYPPLIRRAQKAAAHVTRLVSLDRAVGAGLWEELYEAEQRSMGLYVEAGRILTLAQVRRRRWMVW